MNNANRECVTLVRQAVEWQDAHLGAIRAEWCPTCQGASRGFGIGCQTCGGSGKVRPARLPDAQWRAWYERARAALDAIE